jgi:hypothetical protein
MSGCRLEILAEGVQTGAPLGKILVAHGQLTADQFNKALKLYEQSWGGRTSNETPKGKVNAVDDQTMARTPAQISTRVSFPGEKQTSAMPFSRVNSNLPMRGARKWFLSESGIA